LGPAGELVREGDQLLRQRHQPLVVGHQRFEPGDFLGGDALGELPAMEVSLEYVIGALPGLGTGGGWLKELAAQGTAAEAIQSGHLLEDLLTPLLESRDGQLHVNTVSI
jgi:hypothetical protein